MFGRLRLLGPNARNLSILQKRVEETATKNVNKGAGGKRKRGGLKSRARTRAIQINKKLVACFADVPRRAGPSQLAGLREEIATLLGAYPAEDLNLVNITTLLNKSARCGLSAQPYLGRATSALDRATASGETLSDWSAGNLLYALKVSISLWKGDNA